MRLLKKYQSLNSIGSICWWICCTAGADAVGCHMKNFPLIPSTMRPLVEIFDHLYQEIYLLFYPFVDVCILDIIIYL